jgi:ABC-2 type transport system permease protein
VSIFAIFLLPPLWLKIPAFAGFVFVMSVWISDLYENILNSHPLTKKYQNTEACLKAKNRAVLLFLIPAVGIAGAALTAVVFWR